MKTLKCYVDASHLSNTNYGAYCFHIYDFDKPIAVSRIFDFEVHDSLFSEYCAFVELLQYLKNNFIVDNYDKIIINMDCKTLQGILLRKNQRFLNMCLESLDLDNKFVINWVERKYNCAGKFNSKIMRKLRTLKKRLRTSVQIAH